MIDLEMVVSGTSCGNRMVEVVLRETDVVLRKWPVTAGEAPAKIWREGQSDKLDEEIAKAFSASRFALLSPPDWPRLWQSEKVRRFGVLDAISDEACRKACEAAIREAAEAAKISL